MSEGKRIRYKIMAVPRGSCGRYRAWPDKTTYVRHFSSEKRRADYWRRFVEPKSSAEHGLTFQIVMIDECREGWDFAATARYADVPVICDASKDPSQHIVECGRDVRSRRAS